MGSVLPDYAQRMSSAGRVAKGQIAWLPLLTACTALVASSMAQAPNLALYAVVATAALVTNATANFVGPMTALGGSSPGMGAAFAVSCAIACAAPLVMTWQQTVAAASWAVGVGSLLVAPVAGVMLADYWIMRGRVVELHGWTRPPIGCCRLQPGCHTHACMSVRDRPARRVKSKTPKFKFASI